MAEGKVESGDGEYVAGFDWSILTRQDPMAMVHGQLAFSWTELSSRLATLTDEQYQWCPVPGTLTVCRREDATGRVVGAGDWVAQWPVGPDYVGPRSISWLVAHLTEGFFERWEWTFGEKRRRRDDVELHPTAAAGVAGLTHWVEAWIDGIDSLDAEQVMTVGLSQATEIDASAPFGHLVLHMNRELIHHGAEICLLQDLHTVGG